MMAHAAMVARILFATAILSMTVWAPSFVVTLASMHASSLGVDGDGLGSAASMFSYTPTSILHCVALDEIQTQSSPALAFGVGFGGSSMTVPAGVAIAPCNGAMGRSAISYANVASYDADIGGGFGGQAMYSRLCDVVPVAVSN